MSDLEVATVEGTYVFSEGDVVTIGRRDDNTVILADPTVSRQHASIHFESGAWVLEDLSGGRTFHAGQPIARLEVTQTPETINLASPTGPWISASSGRIERTAGTAVASALSTDDTAGVPVVGATSAFTAGQSVGSAPAPSQWAPSRPVPPHGLPPGGAFPPAGQVPRPPAAPRGSLNSEQIKRALHILFPYRSWIENAGWRSRTRLIFLVYAMPSPSSSCWSWPARCSGGTGPSRTRRPIPATGSDGCSHRASPRKRRKTAPCSSPSSWRPASSKPNWGTSSA